MLNSKIRICSDRNEDFMFVCFCFFPCVFIPDPGIQQACTFFSAVQTSDKGKKTSTLNEHQRSVVKRRDRSVEMFPCLLSPAVVPMPDMIVKPFCSLSQCPLVNSVETISWGFSCVSHFLNGTSKQVSTVATCLLLLASLSHCH